MFPTIRACPARLRRGAAAATTALALSAGAALAGQLELLMFEREGCAYCRQWNEEIGPAYPRTPEGAAAPLRRLDIKAPLPHGVTLTGRPPAFTPTFVLTDDGTEVARIEGYAGDEFFWVLLDRMLAQAGWTPDTAAVPPRPAPQTPAAPN
ncbi:MAG TPA: hypothetical protein PLL33_13725 [Paracoccus sp. (in: a-proteobacteria)]|mgnify:CR=1 FL=1|nr:hypothetical protein [Paracoccus sp. (in: a-proteobacteria)]